MTAIFPGDIKSFTPVIDNFDVVEAANINPVYEEITSIETWLERALPIGYHSRTAALTTDLTLSDTDYPIQYLDPTTDAFTVSLPSSTDTNHIYFIRNTNAAVALSVLSGTDEVVSVGAETTAIVVSDGATWSAISGGSIDYATTISDVSDTDSAAGSSDTVARGDHTHKLNIGSGLAWSGNTLTATGSTDAGTGGIGQNFLINGDFRVAQRGTSFTAATVPLNSDDTYLLDRWILLSDGNDIVDVTQSTVAPTGFASSIKLEVETINKQFAIFQIIENKDALAMIGKAVSLSFQARMAAADDNTHSLKAVILSWTSTADTVTSDCVASWGATITPAANWTAENTASSNTLTTSWQEFKIENVTIDTASTANIGILIYCDQTDGAVDDAVYITGVKLEVGATATANVPRHYEQELALCMRHTYVVIPSGVYGQLSNGFSGTCGSTTEAYVSWGLPSPMRIAPSLTYTAAVSKYRVNRNSLGVVEVSGLAINANTTEYVAYVTITVASGLTQGQSCSLQANNDASAKIIFSSEL